MMEGKAGGQRMVFSLPIEEWHRMGLEGDVLPVTITLEGDSMRPLIRRGRDRVTILPVMEKIRIGDIVLFRSGPTRYVVHRVWKMKDGLIQTLGDNCWNPDPWMPEEHVWGKVIRMERDGRSWRLDGKGSLVWGRFWMAVYPARKCYKKLRALAGRVYRKVFSKKSERR